MDYSDTFIITCLFHGKEIDIGKAIEIWKDITGMNYKLWSEQIAFWDFIRMLEYQKKIHRIYGGKTIQIIS